MNKEFISNKQAIAMIVLFVIGSSLVVGVGGDAKQDAWISIIFGFLMALPIILIYSRILKLFPGKNLYQILDILFGKIIGKIVSVLFIWYCFHLGSLVIRNFYEFAKIALFPKTPEYIFIIFKIILIIWILKEGIEVLGRWASFSLYLITFIFLTITFMSFAQGDMNHLRPVLFEGFKPIFKSAFTVFSFPFVETVCFLGIFNFSKKNKPTKIYLIGLILGFVFIFLATFRNILVLGPDLIEKLYFPSFTAISLINIGDFIQRIEASVAVVLFFGGFVKISVCLLSSCKGFSYVFNINDYRSVVAPISFLTIVLSLIIYESTMEMLDWAANIYAYYAFPFQVILPIAIWIVSEVKTKQLKKANQ